MHVFQSENFTQIKKSVCNMMTLRLKDKATISKIMMMGEENDYVKVGFVISIDNVIFYLYLKVVKRFPSPECSFEFTTTKYIQN